MASLKERVTAAVQRLRERRPFVDHLVRMQERYGEASASQQAGAVTYFAFLSVFPILALAVFVVGYVSLVVPQANGALVDAVSGVLPGLIGTGEGQISLDSVQSFSGLAGVVGLLGVLYSGLGWLSALRDALVTVFDKPQREQPSFVVGKLRDLLTLAVIGGVLLGSVAITGIVSAGSSQVLDWLRLGDDLEWLVKVVSVVLGILANTVLFFAMFELLGSPDAPRRPVWQGALLGAIGFEVLKQASTYLLAGTRGQPAFQAFGIALILLIWINYFSRLTLYAAAFTHTAPASRRRREEEADASDAAVATPASVLASAQAAAGVAVDDAAPAPGPGRVGRHRADGPDGPDGPDEAPTPGAWREGFVEAIDAADPEEVGEASATAARLAHEREQIDLRHRLLALGAAGTAAGLAAVSVVRRRQR